MRELIDKKSAEQGDIRSKLPQFTDEEIKEIRGMKYELWNYELP